MSLSKSAKLKATESLLDLPISASTSNDSLSMIPRVAKPLSEEVLNRISKPEFKTQTAVDRMEILAGVDGDFERAGESDNSDDEIRVNNRFRVSTTISCYCPPETDKNNDEDDSDIKDTQDLEGKSTDVNIHAATQNVETVNEVPINITEDGHALTQTDVESAESTQTISQTISNTIQNPEITNIESSLQSDRKSGLDLPLAIDPLSMTPETAQITDESLMAPEIAQTATESNLVESTRIESNQIELSVEQCDVDTVIILQQSESSQIDDPLPLKSSESIKEANSSNYEGSKFALTKVGLEVEEEVHPVARRVVFAAESTSIDQSIKDGSSGALELSEDEFVDASENADTEYNTGVTIQLKAEELNQDGTTAVLEEESNSDLNTNTPLSLVSTAELNEHQTKDVSLEAEVGEKLEDDTGKTSTSVVTPVSQFTEGQLLKAAKPYHALELDELDLSIGDLVELEIDPNDDQDFWIKGSARSGKRNGQSGYFPKQNLEETNANDIRAHSENLLAAEDDINLNAADILPVTKGTTVTALFAFEPSKQDELAFIAGATIVVLECPEGGWWKGITGMEDKNPVTGWFPANLVRIKDDISKPKAEELFGTDEKTDSALAAQKQVSWFKRLRNSDAADIPLKGRLRSSSAPSKDSKSGSFDMFPTIEGSIESMVPSEDSLRSLLTINKRAETIYETKPLIPEEFLATSSTSSNRASVMMRGTTSGAEFITDSRATMLFTGVLTPGEIMQGASEEKVQDKVSPTIFKFLTDSEKKRLSVVWELIQTERDYVRDLTLITELFMRQMATMQSIGPKNFSTLFANIEQILAVNTDFLVQLIQIEDIRNITAYAEIFLTMEMIKNTPADHSDLIVLNRAIERMQNGVATINECAKRLNGMKPVIDVQNRFSEKINIFNSNRYLVREDVVQVLFSDGKKSRKLFLFNDLLILARKDWRDKHHVIEKTALKDIRVCDIAEAGVAGSSSTQLLELEILPSSEFDQPNRYIISAPSTADKHHWLDAYKSLVRYHVKSKNITDITMTISNADGGDDDDISPGRESTVDDEMKNRKALDSQVEAQSKVLNGKIELLEKVALEREAKIKDWESKVQGIEDECQQKLVKMQSSLTVTQLESEVARSLLIKSKDSEAESQTAVELLTRQLNTSGSELKEKISALTIITSDLNETALKLEKEIRESKELSNKLKDREDVVCRQESMIQQLSDDATLNSTKVCEVASIFGISYSSRRTFAGRSSHSSSNQQLNSSTTILNIGSTERVVEMLEMVKSAADDLIRQNADKQVLLAERQSSIGAALDQISLLKREIFDKDSNLSHTGAQSNVLQKRLSEMEQTQADSSSQIANLKKEVAKNEALLEEQKSSTRKLVSENDNSVFNLSAQIKRDTDAHNNISERLKEALELVKAKETTLRENGKTLSELQNRLQTSQGSNSEKDSTAKQLSDRSNGMKDTLDDIQTAVEKFRAESIITFTPSGGIVAQLKTIFAACNHGLEEGEKKLVELETKRSDEIQELTSAHSKTKEKLVQTKEELTDEKTELDTVKMVLNQVKSNLEQSRTTLDHTKMSAASMERQQKQTQLALEEARKECASNIERLQQQATYVQTSATNIAELERKTIEQSILIKDQEQSLESALKKSKNLEEEYKSLDYSANSKLSSREHNFTDLESKYLSYTKETDVQLADAARQVKQLKSELSEQNQLLVVQKQQSQVESDWLKFDYERQLNHLKNELSECEKRLVSIQLNLHSRELKLGDLEQSFKDSKFKINDQELLLSQYQSKSATKDNKIGDLDTEVFNQVSVSNQLKQRIYELESKLASAQSKLQDFEGSFHRSETTLATANSIIVSLESRNLEYKTQIDHTSDLLKRLDREKKDALQEIDQISHENHSNLKELRLFRERASELSNSLAKSEALISSSAREYQREINSAEEKHRLVLAKETSRAEADNAIIKSEFQLYKQMTESSFASEKAEWRDGANRLARQFEESLSTVNTKMETVIENALKKRDSMLQDHETEIDHLQSKAKSIADSLKLLVSTLSDKLGSSEKDLSQKLQKISEQESTIDRLEVEIQKQGDENKQLKTVSISFEEASYIKAKSFERDIESKSSSLVKKHSDLDEAYAKLDQKLAQISLLNQANTEVQRQILDTRAKFEESQSTVTSLRVSLSSMTDKLSSIEKASNMKEQMILEQGKTIDRLEVEVQKQGEENKQLKSVSLSFEEASYLKTKYFERDIESKSSSLVKKHSDLDEAYAKLEQSLFQISQLKQASIEVQHQILDMRAKFDDSQNNVGCLKLSISSLNEKIGSNEKDMSQKLQTILEQGHIIERLESEVQKQADENRNLKSAHVSYEEASYTKTKSFEREIEAKSSSLIKKQLDYEGERKRLDESIAESFALKQINAEMQRQLVEIRAKFEDITTRTKDVESRNYSENVGLRTKIQDVEMQYHESLLLIERMRSSEDFQKGSILKVQEDFEESKRNWIGLQAQITTLIQERISLNAIISENKALIERKALEKTQLERDLLELKEMSKKSQKENKKVLKAELEMLSTKLLAAHVVEIQQYQEQNNIESSNQLAEYKSLERDFTLSKEEKNQEILLCKSNIISLESKCLNLNRQLDAIAISNQNLSNFSVKLELEAKQNSEQTKKFIFDLESATIQLSQMTGGLAGLKENLRILQAEKIIGIEVVTKLEWQIGLLQKIAFSQTKSVASLQMALTEISEIVSIDYPWNADSITTFPEKLRSVLKAGKGKVQLENVDSQILIQIVKSVRTLDEEKNKSCLELDLQVKKLELLEQQDRVKEDCLGGTKLALQSAGEKIRCQEFESQQKTDAAQIIIDRATLDHKNSETLRTNLGERIVIVTREKDALEKDYIQLYDKLQTLKIEFENKSRAISADAASIIEQNKASIFEIRKQKDKMEALIERLKQTTLEKYLLFEQKGRLEQRLKASNETSKNIQGEISQIKLDNESMSIDRQKLEKQLSDTMATSSGENEILNLALIKSEFKVSSMTDSVREASRVLSEFREKLNFSLNREREVEGRNGVLVNEIMDFKAQIRRLADSNDAFSIDCGQLRSKLVNHEKELEPLKREKRLLEQEILVLRLKSHDRLLAEPIAQPEYTPISRRVLSPRSIATFDV